MPQWKNNKKKRPFRLLIFILLAVNVALVGIDISYKWIKSGKQFIGPLRSILYYFLYLLCDTRKSHWIFHKRQFDNIDVRVRRFQYTYIDTCEEKKNTHRLKVSVKFADNGWAAELLFFLLNASVAVSICLSWVKSHGNVFFTAIEST